MKTELEQQTQTQDALTNVQAVQPYQLTPGDLTSTLPPAYMDEELWKMRPPESLVNPPSTKEINKQMWIASFMGALMVGLTTKDAGAAITGGLLTAIGLHDYGHALQKRAKHVPQMKKDGFSDQAILAYYETGDQKIIQQERQDMLARDKFNEANRDDVRNFAERQRQYDSNSAYRDASMAQRNNFQNASLSLRSQGLDLRRQQLKVMMDKSRVNDDLAGISPRELSRQILLGGVDPLTGKAPTAARIKLATDWQAGNSGYAATRNGLLTNLGQVESLMGMDVSDGTGLIAGYFPATWQTGDGQKVRSLIGNLQSQEFLRNVQAMKGMGALSEAEGARIQSAVAALDPQSGPEELSRQLNDIRAQVISAIERADDAAVFNQWDVPSEPSKPEAAKTESAKTEPAKVGTYTSKDGITVEVSRE